MYRSLFGLIILLLFSCETKKELPLSAETALQHYLENGDDRYHWVLKESYPIEGKSVTAYDLILTSQQWREHTWKHQLTVLVPENLTKSGSLLFITGGSNKDTEPNFKKKDDDTTLGMAMIAEKNQAIVSIIRQTPNQPLYDDLVEDELIS
ncbi:MAG: PhoPQ-activated protein PqaA family protein, partial [Cyclobacteriaceae bacterium]